MQGTCVVCGTETEVNEEGKCANCAAIGETETGTEATEQSE